MSRSTIYAGIRELEAGEEKVAAGGRSRKVGGGRKRLTDQQPGMLKALEKLVEPTTRGDPMSPLRWTCKSTRKLAEELQGQGFSIGERKVADLLHQMKYSLQANAKTIEGNDQPDRNAQFEFINAQTKKFLKRGSPVISVDTKKKELVGNYSNGGKEWQPQDEPEKTLLHDFPDPEVPKAVPYGIYDVGRTRAGSKLALITTRQSLPPTASYPGGNTWVQGPIRTRQSCSLWPTPVAVIATVRDYGKWACNAWPTSLD